MTRKTIWTRLACCGLLSLAAACGGGDGTLDGGNDPVLVGRPPTSNPVPPVPPSPPGAALFGALGQSSSQQFATIGFAYDGRDGGFGYDLDLASFDPDAVIGLRFLAPSQLLLSVPGRDEGVLYHNGGSGTDTEGRLVYLSYEAVGGFAGLSLVLAGAGKGYLASTGQGSWISPPVSGKAYPYRIFEFVYGVPTAAGNVPVSGSATYDIAQGEVGPLTVDFTSRTVSGTIKFPLESGTRTYSLEGVLLTGDATAFAGKLTTGDPSLDGAINGRFVGGAASEMMGRYHLPLANGRAGFLFAGRKR